VRGVDKADCFEVGIDAFADRDVELQSTSSFSTTPCNLILEYPRYIENGASK